MPEVWLWSALVFLHQARNDDKLIELKFQKYTALCLTYADSWVFGVQEMETFLIAERFVSLSNGGQHMVKIVP